MVDSKRFQFTAAVEISYLDKTIQGWSCEYIHESENVNQKQISLLRQAVMDGEISQSQMIDILNGSTIGRPVHRWNRWLRNYWAIIEQMEEQSIWAQRRFLKERNIK